MRSKSVANLHECRLSVSELHDKTVSAFSWCYELVEERREESPKAEDGESEDCYFWSLVTLCPSKASKKFIEASPTLHSHHSVLFLITLSSPKRAHSYTILITMTFSFSLHSHLHNILILITSSSPWLSHHHFIFILITLSAQLYSHSHYILITITFSPPLHSNQHDVLTYIP